MLGKILTKETWDRYEQGKAPMNVLQAGLMLSFLGIDSSGAKSLTWKQEMNMQHLILDFPDKLVVASLDRIGKISCKIIIFEVKNRELVKYAESEFDTEMKLIRDEQRGPEFKEMAKKCKYALTHLQFHDLTYKLQKVIDKQLEDGMLIDKLRLTDPEPMNIQSKKALLIDANPE